jgi:hypothetical protein
MTAAYPGRITVHHGNIGDAEDCRRVVREVIDQHGRLDILVNNGGITVDKIVPKMTDEDWLRVIAGYIATDMLSTIPEKTMETFRSKDGTVTAGNAAGLNDAAAAVVLASKSLVNSSGFAPLGRLVGYGHAGVEPRIMGMGPVPAMRKVLDRAGLKVDEIDVFEVNEAFAAQALAVVRELDLPSERTNPNGSGISLGHPVGASGAILVVKSLYDLKHTGGRYALNTMCIGSGQGIATIFERVCLTDLAARSGDLRPYRTSPGQPRFTVMNSSLAALIPAG